MPACNFITVCIHLDPCFKCMLFEGLSATWSSPPTIGLVYQPLNVYRTLQNIMILTPYRWVNYIIPCSVMMSSTEFHYYTLWHPWLDSLVPPYIMQMGDYILLQVQTWWHQLANWIPLCRWGPYTHSRSTPCRWIEDSPTSGAVGKTKKENRRLSESQHAYVRS